MGCGSGCRGGIRVRGQRRIPGQEVSSSNPGGSNYRQRHSSVDALSVVTGPSACPDVRGVLRRISPRSFDPSHLHPGLLHAEQSVEGPDVSIGRRLQQLLCNSPTVVRPRVRLHRSVLARTGPLFPGHQDMVVASIIHLLPTHVQLCATSVDLVVRVHDCYQS